MSVRLLVADDEPLLREALVALLGQLWPDAMLVGNARNGREALELFEREAPTVCFLDVQMPGLSGIDVARQIGTRAHLVFVTAYDRYAVDAFAAGVLDYLVKPVARERLAETIARLRERIATRQAALANESLLAQLAARLTPPATTRLRWIRSSVGATTRLIAVDDIDYLRSDEKYTQIGWRGDDGKPTEALVRTALKELLTQIDPEAFVQVHRAAAVRLAAIDRLVRHDNDTATIHLKNGHRTLPVSRNFLAQFWQR
jgi:DNA-binding LytR/AlgR family response regulator